MMPGDAPGRWVPSRRLQTRARVLIQRPGGRASPDPASGIEKGDEAEGVGPDDVDDAVIVEPAGGQVGGPESGARATSAISGSAIGRSRHGMNGRLSRRWS